MALRAARSRISITDFKQTSIVSEGVRHHMYELPRFLGVINTGCMRPFILRTYENEITAIEVQPPRWRSPSNPYNRNPISPSWMFASTISWTVYSYYRKRSSNSCSWRILRILILPIGFCSSPPQTHAPLSLIPQNYIHQTTRHVCQRSGVMSEYWEDASWLDYHPSRRDKMTSI